MTTFLCYPKCSTCKKALNWLIENNIDFQQRDITKDNPNQDEIKHWIKLSKEPVTKFFNTSGLKYKALNMKDKVKTLSEDELIKILSTDGMLVKRPILIFEDKIFIGFKEDKWNVLK